MSIEEITNTISSIAQNADPIGATVKFDFGDDGIVHLDGTGDSAVVTNDDKEADCVISMDMDTYEKIKNGEQNGMMAVMMGKVKIKGDMGIAMKLQNYM